MTNNNGMTIKDSSIVEESIETGAEDGYRYLENATVAIVGLGLMGGSLAMALAGHCTRLLGIDRDPAIVTQALERQVVHAASSDPAVLIPQANIVVVAVPVRASLEFLCELPEMHPGEALIFDLGSTKRAVLEAMDALPMRFDPLGCHPMCGKETGTLANAEAGLYHQAPFALVPLPRSTHRARQVALGLTALLGARPLWLEAATHDRWVAATSHLPHLIATALALSTPFESAPLAGPGFRSTSRLAESSAEMWIDIHATNTSFILDALGRYRQQLDTLEDALRRGDFDEMRRLLTMAAEQRRTILGGGR